jgi:hypothetical protein
VLWEYANNEYQYSGFGIDPFILRYNVQATGIDHVFYAGTSDTTSSELMRIKGNGNVGIGYTNPLNRTDIHLGVPRTGTTHATGRPLYVTGNIQAASNGIEFRHSNGIQGIGFGFNTIYATGSQPDQDLGLMARGSAGNLKFTAGNIERMHIQGNGNVGIGTATPTEKLHVSGNAKVTGDIMVDGSIVNEAYISYVPDSGFVNFGAGSAPLAFYKDKEGRVYLRGVLTWLDYSVTTIFVLPEGYRPGYDQFFLCYSDAGPTIVRVFSSGAVVKGNTSENIGEFSLDQISFRAEN